VVQAGGINPLPARVAAMQQYKQPGCVVELQAFLGLFNYYRHCPHCATAYRRAAGKWQAAGENNLVNERKVAFEAAKVTLSAAALLDHPSPAVEMSLFCDASSSHSGAVL
jgi:hypothetical protein